MFSFLVENKVEDEEEYDEDAELSENGMYS